MGLEEIQYLWKDAAGPVVRMEAAKDEVERLAAEKKALVSGERTPEAEQRVDEIDALLQALHDYMQREVSALEQLQKQRKANGSR